MGQGLGDSLVSNNLTSINVGLRVYKYAVDDIDDGCRLRQQHADALFDVERMESCDLNLAC
jgi:hypothetical protein